jgi:hypothetical protein
VTFESGSKLSRIGSQAFQFCSSLSSIDIPSSVQVLGNECLCCCKALSGVTFAPNSKLSHIGSQAFQFCSSLSSICIPAAVLYLGPGVFDCTHLEAISIEEG